MTQVLKQILIFPQLSFNAKAFSVIALVILADFLFADYLLNISIQNPGFGWVTGLFGLVLLAFFSLHNSSNLNSSAGRVILILTIAQCLLLIEKRSLLSLALSSLGLVSLALLAQGGWKQNAYLWLRRCLSFFLRLLRPLIKVVMAYLNYLDRYLPANTFSSLLRGWFLPIIFTVLFITLFANANPVVMSMIERFNIVALLEQLSVGRLLFWLLSGCFILAIIRPKIKQLNTGSGNYQNSLASSFTRWAFSKQAVLRSLIVFNLLFAAQTLMDLSYLWGDSVLPEGISYAQYAHRGAYPLIITALLAAAFVLITQNSDPEIARSKTISRLIYLWVAQNIVLVLSSIYRLQLYVEIYALTYLRVAAFIWMGLVACGLIWIILRSVWYKSNLWLINSNVLTLIFVLTITSFVNIGNIIARYNIEHSRELTGSGYYLDVPYLLSLGSPAIPALLEYRTQTGLRFDSYRNFAGGGGPEVSLYDPIQQTSYDKTQYMDYLKLQLQRNVDDWRRWTYSEHRLLDSWDKLVASQ